MDEKERMDGQTTVHGMTAQPDFDKADRKLFLNIFNPERNVHFHSIVLGLIIGAVIVTSMGPNVPSVVGIMVPGSWILIVEYVSRFMEWIVKRGIPIL